MGITSTDFHWCFRIPSGMAWLQLPWLSAFYVGPNDLVRERMTANTRAEVVRSSNLLDFCTLRCCESAALVQAQRMIHWLKRYTTILVPDVRMLNVSRETVVNETVRLQLEIRIPRSLQADTSRQLINVPLTKKSKVST